MHLPVPKDSVSFDSGVTASNNRYCSTITEYMYYLEMFFKRMGGAVM